MKKIFEDMVPSNRKSIRDIELPNRTQSKRLNVSTPTSRTKKTSASSSVASLYGADEPPKHRVQSSISIRSKKSDWTEQYQIPESSSPSPVWTPENSNFDNNMRNDHPKKKKIWFAGGLIVIVIGFLLVWTLAFARVSIDVTTLSEDVTLNQSSFVAQKNGGAMAVPYTIVTLSEEGVKKVTPSGERQVERASTGKIIIYNLYSNKPHRLIRNTRFETPAGLIFRISDSVTVPGKTTVDGKDVPGSITAVVTADTPGEKGNIPLSDFTIPGFKGDSRYTKFYARSAEPMTGGFIGVEKIVSDDILKSTQAEVQASTIKKLTEQVKKDLIDDQLLYESSIYSETEMLPSLEAGNMVEVKAKVTLYGIVFSKTALAKYIAEANITPFDNSPVTLLNPEEITFSILNKDQVRPWIDSSFNFTLTGKTKITWIFDEDKLKTALLGKPRQAFYTLLPNFPSISTATPHFSPAWKTSFPADPKDIVINQVEK